MTPKFRAWIKDYQVMRSVEFLAFNEKGVAEIFTNPEDGEPEDFRHTHSPEQAILMQSTGVLDDNGAEIFEDDVVIAEGKRGFVMWENGGFQVTIYDGLGYHIDEYQSLLKIGNTFENPELLEEAK